MRICAQAPQPAAIRCPADQDRGRHAHLHCAGHARAGSGLLQPRPLRRFGAAQAPQLPACRRQQPHEGYGDPGEGLEAAPGMAPADRPAWRAFGRRRGWGGKPADRPRAPAR
ncbi:hypothetical protein G6F22_021732 [Rhizopus arrhizus]|nr:hypothetical protein G6F22_021732 [Rhizopus arrhizus]